MRNSRVGERGGSRLNFIIVIAIIGVVAYVCYQVIPVLYNAYLFKDLMQRNVDAASALGNPPNWVSDQLAKSEPEYGVPSNAVITPAQKDNRVEVRVQFTKSIEFPGYTYNYEFDHTVKSTAFLTVK